MLGHLYSGFVICEFYIHLSYDNLDLHTSFFFKNLIPGLWDSVAKLMIMIKSRRLWCKWSV